MSKVFQKIWTYKYHILITLILILAGFFRLWHIEFGLPHCFYADEPEIAELAIKYTFELKDIIANNNYYKLIPISYVYGTLPSYMFTAFTLVTNKLAGILNIQLSKTDIYILMRSFNAVVTLSLVPLVYAIYLKLFGSKKGAILSALLVALNWKLIVHAHYINSDVILTILTTFTFLFAISYFNKPQKSIYVWLLGLMMGFAVGTKITALISLPFFCGLFIIKKDYRSLFGFLFITFGAFAITNPFSIIFIQDFAYRVYEMLFKEGGVVFDSVDYSPFKYISALSSILTPLLLAATLIGNVTALKIKRSLHWLFLGIIIIYILFYSIQSRRVDRWMLPIVPICTVYAVYGLTILKRLLTKASINSKKWFKKLYLVAGIFGGVIIFSIYIHNPITLLSQFQKNTPKSEAYLWARDNLPTASNRLTITEEGLDPMNKLRTDVGYKVKVIKFNVYTSENAQLDFPPDLAIYDYVIISSRPMVNFKKLEVVKKYPNYTEAWNNFEQELHNESKYTLIKSFVLSKPNLIPLSDVYIYKKL
ncbi:MAG: hypothetical protein ACD_22C00172G0013 [uncultured bacterium]|nr:MAG: hypothetical protein ACD_22C00172G0013 [uncultured bacterium]